MQCPKCGLDDSSVRWTRPLYSHIARGHECGSCRTMFETHEVHAQPAQPHAAQPYDPVGLQPIQNTTAHSAPAQPHPHVMAQPQPIPAPGHLDDLLTQKLRELGVEPE